MVPKTPGSYRLGPLRPIRPMVEADEGAEPNVGPTLPDHDSKRALGVR
jgi:hypothetical protein